MVLFVSPSTKERTMDRELNKNQDRRDELLKPYFEKLEKEWERKYGMKGGYSGGIRRFDGLPVSVLEQLVEEGFVDLDEAQNESPTIREFIAFAKRAPQSIFFEGYAVHVSRDDYRLSIEGVTCPTGHAHKTQAFKDAWKAFGKNADEKSVKRLWWD
jgi:hypothetical protein